MSLPVCVNFCGIVTCCHHEIDCFEIGSVFLNPSVYNQYRTQMFLPPVLLSFMSSSNCENKVKIDSFIKALQHWRPDVLGRKVYILQWIRPIWVISKIKYNMSTKSLISPPCFILFLRFWTEVLIKNDKLEISVKYRKCLLSSET